jgi:hypothetical protein
MPIKKIAKSHTSTRKQASKSATPSRRTKKAVSKAPKSAAKTKASKKKADELARIKRRQELTLRAFRMAYEANQRGEFQRL